MEEFDNLHIKQSIIVENNEATSLAEQPLIIASKMIIKPFSYVTEGNKVTVRPHLQFIAEDGQNQEISFDSENNVFSLDADGNHATASMELNNMSINGYLVSNSIYDINNSVRIKNKLKVSADADLGYDETSTIKAKGTMIFEAPVHFDEKASLGNGNDTITVNCGTQNDFIVNARNIQITEDGKINGIDLNSLKSGSSVDLSGLEQAIKSNLDNIDLLSSKVDSNKFEYDVLKGELDAITTVYRDAILEIKGNNSTLTLEIAKKFEEMDIVDTTIKDKIVSMTISTDDILLALKKEMVDELNNIKSMYDAKIGDLEKQLTEKSTEIVKETVVETKCAIIAFFEKLFK